MDNEQLKTAAEKFADNYGNDLYKYEGTVEFTIAFAQSLIDKGVLFEASKATDALGKTMVAHMLEIEQLQSTLSSASKEVKTFDECAEQASKDTFGHDYFQCLAMLDEDDLQTLIKKIAEMYASQFKSSPASTVMVVSDEEIEAKAFKHSDIANKVYGFEEGAKWHREQVTDSCFNAIETEDLKQGLYIAVKAIDRSHTLDANLADRLELISKKLEDK